MMEHWQQVFLFARILCQTSSQPVVSNIWLGDHSQPVKFSQSGPFRYSRIFKNNPLFLYVFFLNIIYLNLSNEFFASIFIFVFYCHSLDITHLSRFWAILISHMDITVYLYAYYCIYAYIVVRDFCTNVHQYSIIVTFVCKQKQPMETFRLVKDLLPGSGMSRLTTRLSNWNIATPARSSDLLELLTAASATTVSVRNELRFWSDLLTQILQYEQ